MILVDTSVWVDHLRRRDAKLIEVLTEGSVFTHPLVIEELACGNLSHWEEIVELLETLPKAPHASHTELLEFIKRHHLYGRGLGTVGIHLLASARLAKVQLWTRDQKLRRAAALLGVDFSLQ